MTGALRTRGALGRKLQREYDESFLCPLCTLAPKDSLHLLVSCVMVDKAWRESLWAISLKHIPLSSPTELIDTILNVDIHLNLEKLNVHAFVLNMTIVLDVIWITRNLVVHQDGQVDLEVMIKEIKRRFVEDSCA